jgi:hypothetical protein
VVGRWRLPAIERAELHRDRSSGCHIGLEVKPFALACPITDEVAVLTVVVTGAPQRVLFATYDIPKRNLWLQFADMSFLLFIEVPQNLVRGVCKWAAISRYAQPLLTEQSICPVMTEDGFPILVLGSITKEVNPAPILPPRQRLLNYLVQISGNHVLSGQTSHANFDQFDADTVALGFPVAIAFCDGWMDAVASFDGSFTTRMLAHAAAGGIIGVLATLPNPVSLGGAQDGVPVNATTLLTPGTLSNTNLLTALDQIAGVLQTFRSAGRAVLFRPMQEMDIPGGFWWGQNNFSTAQFTQLWRFVHDYLTVTKGLDNLIWCFSINGGPGTFAYPGDDVVDVVGIDAYTNTPAATYLAIYNQLRAQAPSKPIALTEWGSGTPSANNPAFVTQTLINDIKASMPRICFVNAWSGWNWSLETNPIAGLTDLYVINRAAVAIP